MVFLYILLCEKDRLYIGVSEDPEQRLSEHQKGRGSLFTKKYRPISICYQEEFDTFTDARYLLEQGFDVTAVDQDASIVEMAKQIQSTLWS